MVLRAKEVQEWTENHKTLLEREKSESQRFHDSKKRLKAIQRKIKESNNQLMKM